MKVELTKEEVEYIVNVLWHQVQHLEKCGRISKADWTWGLRNKFKEAIQKEDLYHE